MKWPRRASVSHRKPAETAISDAIDLVERMGADVRLTDAVILLGQAREKVADYIDAMAPDKAEFDIR